MHFSLLPRSLFPSIPPPPSSSSFYLPSSLLSSFLSLLPSFLLSDYRGQKGKQQKSPKSTLSPTSRTQIPPVTFPATASFFPNGAGRCHHFHAFLGVRPPSLRIPKPL